jgi:hypothetical protein
MVSLATGFRRLWNRRELLISHRYKNKFKLDAERSFNRDPDYQLEAQQPWSTKVLKKNISAQQAALGWNPTGFSRTSIVTERVGLAGRVRCLS